MAPSSDAARAERALADAVDTCERLRMSFGRTAACYRSYADITARHTALAPLARSRGRVELIVQRTSSNERACPLFAELDVRDGLLGDHWAQGKRKPDAQLSLIDSRVAEAIAQRSDWPLAGDNLVVDLALELTALRPGRVVQVGSAHIVITDEPHLGCKKFAARFGDDALRFVNDPALRDARRRGVYARVVQSGIVHVGDAAELL